MAAHTFPGSASGGFNNPFGNKSPSPQPLSAAHPIQQVIEEEEGEDTVNSPTTLTFQSGRLGGDGSNDPASIHSAHNSKAGGPPSAFKPSTEGFPGGYGMGRRTSVSAESLNPTDSGNDKWTPPYHAKTEPQLARLKESIGGHTLYRGLGETEMDVVIGALVEKVIPTKNIKVSYSIPLSSTTKPHLSLLRYHTCSATWRHRAVHNTFLAAITHHFTLLTG